MIQIRLTIVYNSPVINSPWQPGHFYSPIPNETDIERAINLKHQFNLDLSINHSIQGSYGNFKNLFLDRGKLVESIFSQDLTYYPLDSKQFVLVDAVVLAQFIFAKLPRRIIEIGSGHSTALMLDVKNRLDLEIEILSIEPFPARLHERIGENNQDIIQIRSFVQEVKQEIWQTLESGDLLFIDSSHVSKAGSDVNYLFFEVFPLLNDGVYIHLHDIYKGFEYPQNWLREGRSWNEAYLLRAFLMNNFKFSIYLWPQLILESDFRNYLSEINALDFRFPGGSIYLRKNLGEK